MFGELCASLRHHPSSESYRITRLRLEQIRDLLTSRLNSIHGSREPDITIDDLENKSPPTVLFHDGWGNPFVMAKHKVGDSIFFEIYSVDTKAFVRPSYEYRSIHAFARWQGGEVIDSGVTGPSSVPP